MKVEVIGKPSITFRVELDENERKLIKEDLIDNWSEIVSATDKTSTDKFLQEIKDLL